MTVDTLIKLLKQVKKKYPRSGGKLRVELHHPYECEGHVYNRPDDVNNVVVATYPEEEEHDEERVVIIK